MNNPSSLSWVDSVLENNPIELYYQKWLSHYTESVAIFQSIIKTGKIKKTMKKIRNDENIATAHLTEAKKYLEQSLRYKGTPEQSLIKISVLLFLAKLHKEEWETEARENYFYRAVEIFDVYRWNTPIVCYEKEIVEIYLSDIYPDMKKAWKWTSIDPLVPILMKTSILPESRRRIEIKKTEKLLKKKQLEEKHLKEIDFFRNHLMSAWTDSEVIEKLEDTYGSIRICVISEESNEILAIYGFNTIEVEILRKNPANMRHITLNIFDKPRKYAIMIDRGTEKSVQWFEEYQLNNIVNPAIDRFIELNEQYLVRFASDNINTLEAIEKKMDFPLKRNDYSIFIAEVIWKYLDISGFCKLEKHKKNHYADTFLKALDICRNITLQSKNFSQKIDLILWGKMEREVLDKVKSMILSCNETMNGLGFPFGLTKKTIPLEGRIYPIIRAYEALSTENPPEHVRKTMQEWAQGGFFDSDILHVFFDSLDRNEIKPKLPPYLATPSSLSEKNKENQKDRESRYYIPFIQSVSRLLAMTKDIGDKYHKWRTAENNIDIQNIAFKEANELQSEILDIADIPILIYFSRHGKTKSDVLKWPPGNDNELLTIEGEMDSIRKWEEFQGLDFRLLTSPLPRAIQTAKIIRETVRKCAQNILDYQEKTPIYPKDIIIDHSCISCSVLNIEEALINPPKNIQNERYNSLLEELLADNNTKWLLEFLKKLISSPKGSVNLLITHRDTARHLFVLLKNLFSKDQISWQKIAIENDGIYEFTVRWGRLLSDKEKEMKGLLFSVKNWKPILEKINDISKKIFGEIFYDPGNRRIDLIVLHNRFLDFIDQKRENNPDELQLFIVQLETNKLTKHFLPIMKTSKVL